MDLAVASLQTIKASIVWLLALFRPLAAAAAFFQDWKLVMRMITLDNHLSRLSLMTLTKRPPLWPSHLDRTSGSSYQGYWLVLKGPQPQFLFEKKKTASRWQMCEDDQGKEFRQERERVNKNRGLDEGQRKNWLTLRSIFLVTSWKQQQNDWISHRCIRKVSRHWKVSCFNATPVSLNLAEYFQPPPLPISLY